MTSKPNRRWGVLVLAAAAVVSVLALLVTPADESDLIVSAPTPTTTSAATTTSEQPTAITSSTASTTTTTATTVPPVEALIPLSVDSISERVAPSVAFVLSQQGTGSGVVISEDFLVTNAHVVWPDTTVSLVFLNGATFQGRVVAIDPFVDLAVVDISQLTRKPPPISIGSTDDVSPQDNLWVVGYPAPSEFTPEPTIDSGQLVGVSEWEFTGVKWFTIEAPAIGGQSGGAVVDEYGRLVGISTFGSQASLTSISVDDVVRHVDSLLVSSEVRGLDRRQIPHSGARRTNDFSLEGEWDQQLLVGWFLADAEVSVGWSNGDVNLAATTIDGSEIATGRDQIDFVPFFAFPVFVVVDAPEATTGSLESSLPFILYPDPDHGKTLLREGSTAGIYDVGGDRDFFYLDLDVGEIASIWIESAARTRLRVYGPDGAILAEDVDRSGFIGSNAAVELVAIVGGRHVVSLESSLSTVSGYTVVTR